MPMMTVEEIDGDGAVLSSKRTFFPQSWAEEIDHASTHDLEDLDQAAKALKSINSKIADLALDRLQATKILEIASNKAASSLIGDAKAVRAIARSWDMFGASSEVVQEAVKRVRHALFDDELPEFKHIVFVDLELEESSSYDDHSATWLEMKFARDDFDPSTAFTVRIPAAGTISFVWKHAYIASGYEVIVPELDGGAYSSTGRIACSFKLVEVAKAIRDFVLEKKSTKLPYGTDYDSLEATVGMLIGGPHHCR